MNSELEEIKDVGPYGNVIYHGFFSREGKLESVRKIWHSSGNLMEISFWKMDVKRENALLIG